MRIQRPPELQPLRVAETRKPKTAPEPTPAEKEALAWSIHLAYVAQLVYKDLGAAKKWLEDHGCVEVLPLDVGFTQAIAYVREGHRCLVFRGTQGAADIVTDLMCFYYGTPPRHLGFQLGWLFVRKQVRRWLQATDGTDGGLFLAGHSLGAALAVVAAFELTREGVNIERVVTFGCPRVGSYEFWSRYEQSGLDAKTIRFEHGQDGVCVIPPPLLYAHVGKEELLTTPFEPVPPGGVSLQPVAAAAQPPIGMWMLMIALFTAGSNGAMMIVQHILPELVKNRIAPPNAVVTSAPSPIHFDKFTSWLEPSHTPLGRRNPALGYLWFLPVLIAVHYLASFQTTSGLLSGLILKWRWLHWFATAVEAVVVQQVCYAALLRIPTVIRMLLSVLLTGLLFWRFPVRQIESIGVPALVVGIGIFLLIAYRFRGGLPDHDTGHYVKALAARGGPEFQPAPAAAPSDSAEFQAHLRVLEEIASNPVQSAYFDKAIEQIRKRNP